MGKKRTLRNFRPVAHRTLRSIGRNLRLIQSANAIEIGFWNDYWADVDRRIKENIMLRRTGWAAFYS